MDPRLNLELRSRNMGAIASQLPALRNRLVGGKYVIDEVVACGATSIICKATGGSGHELACKCPLLQYHRPSTISREQILQARARLEEEFTALKKLGDLGWPRPEALVTGLNPLLPLAWGPDIRESELFLFMEWVEGDPLMNLCRKMVRERDNRRLASIIKNVVQQLVPAIVSAGQRGYLYTDLKPRHIILQHDVVRLLDAGGALVRSGKSPAEVAPGYLIPSVLSAFNRGEGVAVSEAWVVHGLGKTLFACCTDIEPVPGFEYSIHEHAEQIDAPLREYIDSLLTLRWSTLSDLSRATTSVLNI
jgi:hypothetical protein